MGINGLLPLLKSIQKEKHISQYSGCTVAIDTYCWLHKAIYTCAMDLGLGKDTDKWIAFCIKKIETLLAYKIRPVVVFDGGPLPSKAKTESERDCLRKQNREQALEYMKNGNFELASRKFGESIDITPEMAHTLLTVLRDKHKIECIVSPYEADAQLAYLSRIGYVDLVITEDSDLLAFGAKKVFYKMDASGNGKEICFDDIKLIKELQMDTYSYNTFLCACIFSGCDYLESIKGIGAKTAFKLMNEKRTYKKVIYDLRMEGKWLVPPEYEESFEKAYLTFKFQRVFCPIKKKLVTLSNIDLTELREKFQNQEHVNIVDTMVNFDSIEDSLLLRKMIEMNDISFIGQDMSVELANKIAYAVINPITKKPYEIYSRSNTCLGISGYSMNNKSDLSTQISDGAVIHSAELETEKKIDKNIDDEVNMMIKSQSKLKSYPIFSQKMATNTQNYYGTKHFKIGRLKLSQNLKKDKKIQPKLSTFLYHQHESTSINGAAGNMESNFFSESYQMLKNQQNHDNSDNENNNNLANDQDLIKINEEISKEYNICYDPNSKLLFKNSKRLNKGFKVPSQSTSFAITTNDKQIIENTLLDKLDQNKYVKKEYHHQHLQIRSTMHLNHHLGVIYENSESLKSDENLKDGISTINYEVKEEKNCFADRTNNQEIIKKYHMSHIESNFNDDNDNEDHGINELVIKEIDTNNESYLRKRKTSVKLVNDIKSRLEVFDDFKLKVFLYSFFLKK